MEVAKVGEDTLELVTALCSVVTNSVWDRPFFKTVCFIVGDYLNGSMSALNPGIM